MPPLQLSGVCMLEFLLVFHSDATRASATAILKADLENEAMRKARAIALHDGRIVELWRNQRMLARFARQDNRQDNHPDGDPG
jgi:plasmid stability protein